MDTEQSKMQKEHFIRCSCGAMEHQALLSYFPDEEPQFQLMYLQIHLITWEGFFRRLWTAIRYLLGYRSRYGHWDEILIDPQEGEEIKEFIEQWLLFR